MPLRIIFMATPEFSVPSLTELARAGHDIVACYSQPPRPAGKRGLELKKSPVHEKAEALGIAIFTPTSLKDEADQDRLVQLNADVAVVIAYGMLLPAPVLKAPTLGCYNGHASLLPRWRGAAPVHRAIMAGDTKTGVNIMKMDEGLDTGPIALEARVAITANMTTGELHDRLSGLTAELMVKAMAKLETGTLKLAPQATEGATYAHKITKQETRIEWDKPSVLIHNHIRGLSPFPGSWCEMQVSGKSQRVKILESEEAVGSGAPGSLLDKALTVACAHGAVRLTRLQLAGKKPQDAAEFLRGNTVEAIN